MIEMKELTLAATALAVGLLALWSGVQVKAELREACETSDESEIHQLIGQTIEDPKVRRAAEFFFANYPIVGLKKNNESGNHARFAASDMIAPLNMVDVSLSIVDKTIDIINKVLDWFEQKERIDVCHQVCGCQYQRFCHLPICPDVPFEGFCAVPPVCAPFCRLESIAADLVKKDNSTGGLIMVGIGTTTRSIRTSMLGHPRHATDKLNRSQNNKNHGMGTQTNLEDLFNHLDMSRVDGKLAKKLQRAAIMVLDYFNGRQDKPKSGSRRFGHRSRNRAVKLRHSGVSITGAMINESANQHMKNRCKCPNVQCARIDLNDCEGRCPTNPQCSHHQCRCLPLNNVLPLINPAG